MQRRTAVPFWRDVRVLSVLSQIIFVLVVFALFGFLFSNLTLAMRQRGLVAGFDYLRNTSGFEIGESIIPYRPTDTYGRAYVVGLLNTLQVSVVGIILATILGVIVGVARLSTNWLVNRLAAVYIEIIRNTPLLVQLVFIYFGVFFQLPPVAETITLPGHIFANQRGIPTIKRFFGIEVAREVKREHGAASVVTAVVVSDGAPVRTAAVSPFANPP